MYIILLKFSENKHRAGAFMDAHKAWIKRGFGENVFLLAGSLQPNVGGVLLAHNSSLEDIQIMVDEDPFVQENIVTAEILEVTPAQTEERMKFLLD